MVRVLYLRRLALGYGLSLSARRPHSHKFDPSRSRKIYLRNSCVARSKELRFIRRKYILSIAHIQYHELSHCIWR